MYRSLIAIATALLLATGCAPMAADSEKLTERSAPLEYNSVVFTDYDLSRSWDRGFLGSGNVYRLTVEKHGQRPTATGTTEVFVVLRNHTDYDYQIEARTSFVDRDGVPVDVKPVWQRSTIPANSVGVYKTLSTSTQPLQYRVEVREIQ